MNEKDLQKKKIGSRIKVVRNELGLTMKDFGQKFDPPASDSIVSRWERGISTPNNERLKRIAELGNISMFYLTTGKKAVSDLSTIEKEEIIKKTSDSFKQIENDQKEYLKKELERIQINELNFVETLYLVNILDFLKFSDRDDVIQAASLFRMLNSSIEVGEGEAETDNSLTQEELNQFINEELKDFEELLRKRFS